MPTLAEKRQAEKEEAQQQEVFVAKIKQNYLSRVGRPENYQKLNCRQVYGNRWRLTMWLRSGDYGSTIGPSHFVTVDEDGGILEIK